MNKQQDIEDFYSEVERQAYRFPNAAVASITGESKSNVSKYLNKKLVPSQDFINRYFNGLKSGKKVSGSSKIDKPDAGKQVEVSDNPTMAELIYINKVNAEANKVRAEADRMNAEARLKEINLSTELLHSFKKGYDDNLKSLEGVPTKLNALQEAIVEFSTADAKPRSKEEARAYIHSQMVKSEAKMKGHNIPAGGRN